MTSYSSRKLLDVINGYSLTPAAVASLVAFAPTDNKRLRPDGSWRLLERVSTELVTRCRSDTWLWRIYLWNTFFINIRGALDAVRDIKTPRVCKRNDGAHEVRPLDEPHTTCLPS